jgi:hypothetical protein
MKVTLIDKIILLILGFEHVGFGLLGLFSPLVAAGFVGFGLNELTAFSEVRSHYSLFLVIGIMAFISVLKFEMMGFTYKIYVLVFGSFLIGRFYSIFADGMPNSMLWYVISAELAVVLIALWRLRILNSH